jgi:pimeloyl-ACP methyl ester carboxylesterase
MDTAEVDRLRIAYECAGTGPPLVLLHGYVRNGPTTCGASLPVAEDLHATIRDPRLVVLPHVGHACNVEAPEEFNRAVRTFLRDRG